MSEIDRIFPSREEQEARTSSSEKRLILHQRSGKTKMVEVVHVRRDRPRLIEDRPRPAPWSVRAEMWPEGFCAKSPSPLPQLDLQPIVHEPAQPTTHVIPTWEPSPPQPAQPVQAREEIVRPADRITAANIRHA